MYHVCTPVSHTESFIGELMDIFIRPSQGTSFIFDDEKLELRHYVAAEVFVNEFESLQAFITSMCLGDTISVREARDALIAFDKAVCSNAPAGEIALLALAVATATSHLLGKPDEYRDSVVAGLMERNGFHLVDGKWKRCIIVNGEPVYYN